jgi:ABC-2 type transport system permease protein
MPTSYSQVKGMLAITKASLKAIFRSPQAVFFSLFFPIVLIWIFGALSGGKNFSVDVAFDKNTDSTNDLYAALKTNPLLHFVNADEAELMDRLKKGRITAVFQISKQTTQFGAPQYNLHLKTSSASKRDLQILEPILRFTIDSVMRKAFAASQHIDEATVSANVPYKVSMEEVKGREYKTIDFYLPGMIGFSLIGAAIFGVAFVFYSFRETLVLKRLFSTPIKKSYIIIGESLARIIFLITTAIILILFGTYFYDFTLAHGATTFIELLVLSFIGILAFMGFGYIISGIAKNQNVIPIYANLLMFPQYFLSGTFFSKNALPAGLQPFLKFLPLTALNDAMRKVSFEGVHLNGVLSEIGVLCGWIVIVYFIAFRVFKWE